MLKHFEIVVCRRVTPWALVALMAVSSCLAAENAANGDRKVLFIGIDGCRFDALKAPNLDRLMSDGCYDDDTQILGQRPTKNDTVSGPGWSSILTGVWADKHGVNDNEFQGKNYAQYPHFFHRLKQALPKAYTISIVDWTPIQEHIVSAADVGQGIPPPDNDYPRSDALVAKAAVAALAERDPTAMFVYFGQVDETGHKDGFHPTVPSYIKAIETVDSYVGEVLAAVKARKTFPREQWLVLVTSDHGGKGTGHGGGHNIPEIRNSFMIVSGAAARRGKLDDVTYLVDVPVTALAYLGVTLDSAWKLDGRAVGLKSD